MTGHELRALLEQLSAERLDLNLYLEHKGVAVEITPDNLLVQPDSPMLGLDQVEPLSESADD